MKVIYNYYFIATETLAFLYEILKSYNLGHIRGHMIRILKLPKIAKIDSIWPAVPQYIHSTPFSTPRSRLGYRL